MSPVGDIGQPWPLCSCHLACGRLPLSTLGLTQAQNLCREKENKHMCPLVLLSFPKVTGHQSHHTPRVTKPRKPGAAHTKMKTCGKCGSLHENKAPFHFFPKLGRLQHNV